MHNSNKLYNNNFENHKNIGAPNFLKRINLLVNSVFINSSLRGNQVFSFTVYKIIKE